jgi:predicted ArsR family transcriptional regulator
MSEPKVPGVEMLKKKFEQFKQLKEEVGEEKAWEKVFEGYPERQKKNMGQFIENNTLAEGFSKAVPYYKQIGMDMEVVDISNNDMDAVLEIQKTCPVLSVSKEYGFDKPCGLICALDVRATKEAFPGMKGAILSAQADGDSVCLFKYERKKK